jgi:hypothetical protein
LDVIEAMGITEKPTVTIAKNLQKALIAARS